MIRYLNRDHLALLLCLSLSLTLYFSSNSSIVISVKAEMSDIISIIKYPQEWYVGLLTTEQENIILKQRLALLNYNNIQLRNSVKEVDELKKILKFYDVYPVSMQIGKIINDNSSYLTRTLMLNLGKSYGLKKNNVVVDINGLFGRIIAVGDRASQVRLINDKNYKVSIRVGEDLSLGQFIPTHDNLGIIDGIIKTAKISVSDTVYTSGISTIYPDLIPVAKVISIDKNEEEPFQKIIVKILADLDNYNHVFVIL